MTRHLSERFHDHERRGVYLDLVQSSLDRPLGSEQAWLLDRIGSTELRPAKASRPMPHLSLRWFALPVPFLSWAST